VEELAAACRFHDCGHESEPGCAVTEALREGRLTLARFDSWRLMQRELRSLEMRQNHRLRSEERRKWRIQSKAMRLREKLGD
jgi:ribosome biogenesis GTPase